MLDVVLLEQRTESVIAKVTVISYNLGECKNLDSFKRMRFSIYFRVLHVASRGSTYGPTVIKRKKFSKSPALTYLDFNNLQQVLLCKDALRS